MARSRGSVAVFIGTEITKPGHICFGVFGFRVFGVMSLNPLTLEISKAFIAFEVPVLQ